MSLADESLFIDGARPLDRADVEAAMGELPGWQLIEVDEVLRLTRSYSFNTFADALAFTSRVGELAETQNHHPALLTEWGKVTVSWWTHSLNGVTRNDLIMAACTDRLQSSLR